MTQPAASFTKDHVPGLDALRGLAVLLILWTHAPKGLLGEPIDALKGYVQPGYLGVDLFFVLSGFLITRILLVDKEGGRPLRWFLLRRALRIFPIYYLVVATVAVVRPGPELPWCALYASNFYFPFHHDPTLLRHSWSLAVEEHFYLLWPLAVYALPTRKGVLAAVTLIPFAIACAVAAILLDGDPGRHWISAHVGDFLARSYDSSEFVYMGTMFRAESLALGALFAFSERRIERRPLRALLFALGGGLAAAVLVRGSFLRVPPNWIPLIDLVGFTGISGATVLGLIAAHYAGRSEAWRARIAASLSGPWPRLGVALFVHVVLEAGLFLGLRWNFTGADPAYRGVGMVLFVASLLGMVVCATVWVGAWLRWLQARLASASIVGSIAAFVLAVSLAALVSLQGWRFRMAGPSVLPTVFLGVTALLLAITSLQRLGSAADAPSPLRTARSLRLALVAVAAALFTGTVVLGVRASAPAWSSLDTEARGHFAVAAVLYLVILLFVLRVSHGVGRISYGLYLYHLPIYVLVGVRDAEPYLPRLAVLGIAVAVTFGVAALSYRFLERPILRWAQRFR